MEGFGRGFVMAGAVAAGWYLGGQIDVALFCDSDNGACIPLIGTTIGAVIGGTVAARLTDPRRRKPFHDPDLEAGIVERERRWRREDEAGSDRSGLED